MKRVVILGSTGSIGENALRVMAAAPDRFRVTGLCAWNRSDRLLEQARDFKVRRVAVGDPHTAAAARAAAPAGVRIAAGMEGVCELAAMADADIVLCAVVGLAGLRPVMAAMRAGHDVALATKEVLVAAGAFVMNLRAQSGVRLLPVDSEHSALFQCLESRALPICARRDAWSDPPETDGLRRLVLTASGGPFGRRDSIDFERVSVREALRHPRWSMGPKITIDSATMMNKGLEIIEAHWLFGLPLERIDVLLHPESIVHGLVEFDDGNLLAQCSLPDMRFAIHYALNWPDRAPSTLPRLRLEQLSGLHFHAADARRFPCLALAREAARRGGTCPAVLNAANEVAVQAFLGERMPFAGIARTVEHCLNAHAPDRSDTLEAVEAADTWARRCAGEAIEQPKTGRRRQRARPQAE